MTRYTLTRTRNGAEVTTDRWTGLTLASVGKVVAHTARYDLGRTTADAAVAGLVAEHLLRQGDPYFLDPYTFTAQEETK